MLFKVCYCFIALFHGLILCSRQFSIAWRRTIFYFTLAFVSGVYRTSRAQLSGCPSGFRCRNHSFSYLSLCIFQFWLCSIKVYSFIHSRVKRSLYFQMCVDCALDALFQPGLRQSLAACNCFSLNYFCRMRCGISFSRIETRNS